MEDEAREKQVAHIGAYVSHDLGAPSLPRVVGAKAEGILAGACMNSPSE